MTLLKRTNNANVPLGDIDALWKVHGRHAKADDRIGVQNDPTNRYGKLMRVIVKDGDTNVVGSGSGERAEVMTGEIRLVPGQNFAFTFGVMVPPGFRSPSGGWNVISQFHANAGGTQSPFHCGIEDGTKLNLRFWGGPLTNILKRDYPNIVTITGDVMYDVFVCGYASPDPNVGWVEVWINGKLYIPKTFLANVYEGDSPYYKMGHYRDGSANYDSTLHFKDIVSWAGVGCREEGLNYLGWGGVTNPAPDPVITTGLPSGATLIGQVPWVVTVKNKEVIKVEFYVNNQLIQYDASNPYEMTLDSIKYPNGTLGGGFHVHFTDGTIYRSPSYTWNVQNPVTPVVNIELAKQLLIEQLDYYFVGQLGYSVERAKRTRSYKALVALGGTWR